MKKITLTVILTSVFSGLFSQNSNYCATDYAMEQSLEQHPELKVEREKLEAYTAEWIKQNPYDASAKSGATYVIPIVFHVLHDNGPENISKEQILSQVDILNDDYSASNTDLSSVVSTFQGIIGNASIEFRLAQKDPSGNCTDGINRIETSFTHSAVLENSIISNAIWPRGKYMNVFVVSNINVGPGGPGVVAGYTYNPGGTTSSRDAIMMRSNYIGSKGTSNYTNGRTLTHEAGHWLNLSHLWGSTNEPAQPANCNYDDGVADTPNTEGWQSCNLGGTTCGSLDNVQNFLEYSFCSRMFTAGQVSRMHAALNQVSYRTTLWSGSNLIATGVDKTYPPCIPVAEFHSSTQLICANDSINFTDKSWRADPTSWSWTFTGGTPSSSTDSMPVITYNTPGTYAVTLVSGTTTGNSSAKTKTGYIEVRTSTPAHTGADGYAEDFPTSNGFSADWDVENGGGSVTWEHYTGAGYNSSSCLRINNISTSSKSGDIDALVSKGIDLDFMPGTPRLYFKLAYKRKATDDNDRLKVYYSVNCGETWVLRKTLSGAGMASVTGTSSTSWTPSSDNDWKEHYAVISPAANFDNVLVKFEFEAGATKGNNIYLDAINIFDPASIGGKEMLNYTNLTVYPNPMDDQATIAFELFDKQQVSLKVFDILGQEVKMLENSVLNAGEQQYRINTNDLASGIYHIQLNIEGKQLTQKIIVH